MGRVVGELEASSGSSLVWGKVLSVIEGRMMRVECRAGRWVKPGCLARECVVLIQHRLSGQRPFVFALEAAEAESVLIGLKEWFGLVDAGSSDRCFVSGE